MTRTLAIDGGRPLRRDPMPAWPCPGDDEVAAVTAVLRSGRINYWTGTEGRELEREYAQILDRRHAIVVANGTLALELALRAFRIGSGDEVIVPSRTFVATAAAVVSVGAVPIIADIDPDSGNITADTIEPLINSHTRAVIPVHLGGWPVDMAPIVDLAGHHGLTVIEDCAQAHGGARSGRPVGSLGSHAAAFSFCQDKILPTGEGGILLLDDDEAYARAWAYKDHGKALSKVSDPSFMTADDSFKWLVDSFGTNWRMDELVAAMGRVGLQKLPFWHESRRENALRLAERLGGVPSLRVPLPDESVEHAFYRLYAFIDPDALASGWSRDRVLAAIAAEGVPCQYGTCAEIYREAAFVAAGLAPADRLPGAARAHETSIAFFVHPTLGPDEMDVTAEAVRSVMEAASR